MLNVILLCQRNVTESFSKNSSKAQQTYAIRYINTLVVVGFEKIYFIYERWFPIYTHHGNHQMPKYTDNIVTVSFSLRQKMLIGFSNSYIYNNEYPPWKTLLRLGRLKILRLHPRISNCHPVYNTHFHSI